MQSTGCDVLEHVKQTLRDCDGSVDDAIEVLVAERAAGGEGACARARTQCGHTLSAGPQWTGTSGRGRRRRRLRRAELQRRPQRQLRRRRCLRGQRVRCWLWRASWMRMQRWRLRSLPLWTTSLPLLRPLPTATAAAVQVLQRVK